MLSFIAQRFSLIFYLVSQDLETNPSRAFSILGMQAKMWSSQSEILNFHLNDNKITRDQRRILLNFRQWRKVNIILIASLGMLLLFAVLKSLFDSI